MPGIAQFWQTLRPLRKVGKLRTSLEIPTFSINTGIPVGAVRALESFNPIINTSALLKEDEEITVEFWMKLDALVNVPFKQSHGGANPIWLFSDAGTLTVQVETTLQVEAVTTVMPSGTWVHAAVVFSFSGGFFRFYLDGELAGEITGIANPLDVGGGNLSTEIGILANITQLRIWNVARTQDEIQYYKDRLLAVNTANLLAYYYCNEGSGLVLDDKTATGADMTVPANAVWTTDIDDLPMFGYGISYVVSEFAVGYENFSLRYPVASPVSPNFLAVIRWLDSDGEVQRRRLWDHTMVDIAPVPVLYAGELLFNEPVFEIWAIDGYPTVDLTAAFEMLTSVMTVVTSALTTASTALATLTSNTNIYTDVPIVFPGTFDQAKQ